MAQKHYKFGMAVESVQPNQEHPDFEVYRTSTNTDQENPNPYGKSWFDDPNKMAKVEQSYARITSIPSPYARMHITDLAFRELNAGSNTMSEEEMMGKVISNDYLHAMSHCLDMFELFYYFDELDLREKGIRVERINLVDPNDPSASLFLRKNEQTKRYLETLDLFRKQYLKALNKLRPANYKFRFNALYVFWDEYTNTVIGATSPFTGFFAKSTCDVLTEDETPDPRLVIRKGDYVHNLLTNNPKDWLTLKKRPEAFQKFMYLLLHKNTENLGAIYTNLFETVKQAIGKEKQDRYDAMSFNTEFPEYNFGNERLPRILSGEEVYLRTSDIDRSFLKYMLYLYLEEPMNFDILEEDFKKPIDQREFPEGTRVPWICVNDLLSDALFVLPYDVNDKYVAVSFYDRETKKEYRRCLLPIKQSVLKYFPDQSLADIANNMKIVRYENGHYVVNYKVKLDKKDRENRPVYVTLRREYWPNQYEYPNGILYGPEVMENFAFGIYPFVKSRKFTNIYKVLFYNKFNLALTPKHDEFELKYFYFKADQNTGTKEPFPFKKDSVKRNYTDVFDPRNPEKTMNTLYYSIEEANEDNRVKCIEFAELSVDVKDKLGKVITQGTSLIVPVLEEKETINSVETKISVDLGTSNTYVALQRGDEASPREVNTIHVDRQGRQYSELQFMNVNVTSDDFQQVRPKYGHDLYLRPSQELCQRDDESKEDFEKRMKAAWTGGMPAQFCEFIPAHIVPRKDVQRTFTGKAEQRKGEGFSFPIPTVINCLRDENKPVGVKKGNKVEDVLENKLPLTHSAIPFAYYEIGKRPNGDTIAEGNFKWFMNKNVRNEKNEVNLTMFVSELLFILRSHILSEGWDLDSCLLYWTYPLSFDDKLEEHTSDIWKNAYKKYFTKASDDYTPNELDKRVMRTNESLSPFYECVSQADQQDFTVLMDIGGGSTDIIGYDEKKAQFITSFEFAGNALYLNSKRNHPYRSDEPNVYTYYLEKRGSCEEMKNGQRSSYFGDVTRLITGALNTEDGLAALMNYGFQMYEKDFKLLFGYPEIEFMLKFYAASIVYHTAQLCYWYSKQRVEKQGGELALPHFIYLTGNGSKLLSLLGDNERDRLFEKIFLQVYGKSQLGDEELVIKSPMNPKIATARGALKAPAEVFNKRPDACVIMLGDENTIQKLGRSKTLELRASDDRAAILKAVRANVEKFVDFFYKYLGTDYPLVEKKLIINQIDSVEKDQEAFHIDNQVSDSYFFLYIARIMEKISVRLVDKLQKESK